MVAPQWRPSFQREPANLDVRVRAGLYAALDRATLAEGLLGTRELALYSLLPPGHVDYEATRDGLRQHAYHPDRARALLREAGWSPGADGMVRNAADGRRFQTSLTSGPVRGHEIAAIADYWRRVGVDVRERVQTAAEENDLEVSSTAPGWFFSGRGGGDNILNVLEGPPGTPENRWVGERTGYDSPTARTLVDAYRRSLTAQDRQRALGAVSSFVANELPFLLTYSSAYHLAVRASVDAFRDFPGGAVTDYGPYVRNAHVWDIAR